MTAYLVAANIVYSDNMEAQPISWNRPPMVAKWDRSILNAIFQYLLWLQAEMTSNNKVGNNSK